MQTKLREDIRYLKNLFNKDIERWNKYKGQFMKEQKKEYTIEREQIIRNIDNIVFGIENIKKEVLEAVK